MRKLFQKMKHKKLFIITATVIVYLCINAFTMKGFYNTLNYPEGTVGFLNNEHCFMHGILGEKVPENVGVSYIKPPQNMDDYTMCGSSYKSVLWTFVVIDRGRWIGVHVGPCLFMIETRWRDSARYTAQSKRLGFPYYIMWYHGGKAGFTKWEQQLYYKYWEGVAEREENQ